LLSLLKAKGWAEELLAGENASHSDFATFIVTVTLTEAGNAHADDVAQVVFAFLAMMAEAPPQRWVFDEISDVSRMRLRFLDAVDPAEAVLHVTRRPLRARARPRPRPSPEAVGQPTSTLRPRRPSPWRTFSYAGVAGAREGGASPPRPHRLLPL
jgi:hypothetical protein